MHVACILFTLVFFLDVPLHDTLFVCSGANPTFLAPSHRLFVSATYSYPTRIRFPNILTGKVQWLTIGYIPIIKCTSEDSAEKTRVRVLQDSIFQRCLAALMQLFIRPVSTGIRCMFPACPSRF